MISSKRLKRIGSTDWSTIKNKLVVRRQNKNSSSQQPVEKTPIKQNSTKKNI